MDIAIQELTDRLRGLSREQLLELDADDLARADWLLIDELCAEKVASFDAGPLVWLTKHTCTENPQHAIQGLPYRAGFPCKSYFVPLFKAFLTLEVGAKEKKEAKSLFVCKSREMLTSWSAMGFASWLAEWHNAEVIVQVDKEEKAKQLLSYCDCLYRNQKPFLQKRHPLARPATALAIEWANGGRIFGIPSGETQVRSYHPTLLILDEACFLPGCEQVFNAALPATQMIIGISTAGPSWFGDQCTL